MRQEPDRVPVLRTLAALAGLLLFMALGAGGALWLLRAEEAALLPRLPGRGAELTERGPATIGGVEQTLIDADTSLEALRAQQRRELETYGWSERDSGYVHVPIEEAMRRVAEEGR